ncbi:MAG: aspartate aminotransferase family protein [Cyanobacteria bacterium]|nr:aspartate aminotransferase family protein [Cyanobacteriota bacterium]
MTEDLTTDEILSLRKQYLLPTAVHYYQKPLELVRAKGNYVYDETGREYLDCIGGIVCNSAGHNHPVIQARMKAMIESDEIQHVTTLYLNQHIVKLAEKLASLAPEGVNRCAFTNSGSEANELAFMAARHATGETTIVNLRHSYHGGTSAALAACGHHTWRFRSQPVAQVTSAMEPNCYRCPFGQKPESCHLECADNVETTIQTTTHGKIAAFIAEPVMGVGGFIAPPKEYFHRVAAIVHNYGGKYISDEVQTGAGRCGGAYLLTKELEIPADVITMAKGFGNGAAIGAVVMRDDVADPLAGKLYFNTFAGDPFQSMQALTTMEIIEEERLIENARDMGDYLRQGLLALQSRFELIGDVRGRGLLMGVELVSDRKTKAYASAETNRVMEICRDKGVLIGKGGLFGNVLRLAPALSINREQIDHLLQALEAAFLALQKETM